MRYSKYALTMAVVINSHVFAASFSAPLYTVCPEAWSDSSAVIPVITHSLNPWAASNEDKSQSQNHLMSANVINTIDRVPGTSQDIVDDLLTVASECLVYRNFEVEDSGLIRPPNRNPITDRGWMPSVIF